MANHINIQIIIQHVTDEPEKADQYGKVLRKAVKSTLEERINLVGSDKTSTMERAKAALDVIFGNIPWT